MRTEQIGDCTLILGDSRDVVPSLSVDSVFADPPYGVGLTAKSNKWVGPVGGDGYSSIDDSEEFVRSVCVPIIEACRLVSPSVAVTPGTRSAWFYPKPDALGGIYNRNGAGSGKWGFECMAPILFYGKDPYLSAGLGRRANAWEQPGTDFAEKNGHPCPKPMGLMMWMVERVSLPGQILLDPFMGSGTTGVACIKQGRKFIGIELDPDYFDIACKRIEEAHKQTDLFVPVPPKLKQTALALE